MFTLCCGPSSSLYIPIFKRFKAAWGGVTSDSFRGLVELQAGTEVFLESTMHFLSDVATKKSQVRDDYKELIELTMVVLGKPPANIHWRAPGPIHHARWMAKLLYLFRDQRVAFNLIKKEELQLQRFVQFGALFYNKAWIEAPLAAEAPGQDLNL